MKIISLLFLTLCVSSGPAQSVADKPDSATLYLRAWSFKDYGRMYDLSSQATRAQMPRDAFYTAASGIGPPTADPEIVSRTKEGSAEVVYFQYKTSGTDLPARGSITVLADGIEHAQLSAARATVAPTVSGVAPSAPIADAQVTIEGETVDTILDKITKATDAAESLKADVSIRGSLLGQSMNETGTLLYKAPGKFRMNFSSFVMNSDGKNNILYMPPVNMYMNIDQLGQFELSPGIGTSGQELKERYDVQLSRKTELNGEPAFELKMSPPQSGTALPAAAGKQMTLMVSAKSWLPLRASMAGMQVEYKKLQVNAPDVTDAQFVFAPPTGAQELSLGGLLGSLGGAGAGLPQ